MKPGWRILAKTIVLTAAITTAFWFAMAAWWYQRNVAGADQSAPVSQPAKVALERMGPTGAAKEQGLIIPVSGVRPDQLVDTFTQARENGARPHDAIDIMAPRGTPVIAAAPGRVEKLFLS